MAFELEFTETSTVDGRTSVTTNSRANENESTTTSNRGGSSSESRTTEPIMFDIEFVMEYRTRTITATSADQLSDC